MSIRFLRRQGAPVRNALIGVGYVMRRPKWAVLVLVLAFILACIVYLSINFGFYGSLLGSGLPLADKLQVIGLMIQSMTTSFVNDISGMLLLAVALLQGVAISVLIFTARRNRKLDAMVAGRSGVALAAAAIGLGCVPCGTSLIVPLLTLLFSSSAPAMLGAASLVVLAIALVLTVYSIISIGQVAYKYKIAEEVS